MINSDSESLDSQINEIIDLDVQTNDDFQNDNVFGNESATDDQLDDQLDSSDFSLDDKLINDRIVKGSLMERNLEYLSSSLVGSGRSINPVSVLLDQLQHPDADLGENKPSCLKWAYNSKHKIDHLVLGKGKVGGAWHKMADCNEILTISLR